MLNDSTQWPPLNMLNACDLFFYYLLITINLLVYDLFFLGKGESFSYVQILDNPGNLGLCYAAPYSYPEQVRLQRIRQNYLVMIFFVPTVC